MTRPLKVSWIIPLTFKLACIQLSKKYIFISFFKNVLYIFYFSQIESKNFR